MGIVEVKTADAMKAMAADKKERVRKAKAEPDPGQGSLGLTEPESPPEVYASAPKPGAYTQEKFMEARPQPEPQKGTAQMSKEEKKQVQDPATAPSAAPQVNLQIWAAVANTDRAFTKAFDNGRFKGTDINPTYRAMKMTEQFGPYGQGWGWDSLQFEQQDMPDGQILVVCQGSIWYMRDGQRHVMGPHRSSDYLIRETKRGITIDEEVFKKVQTDVMTTCFRFLGISADVYMGLWDNSKYQEGLSRLEAQEIKGAGGKKEVLGVPMQADPGAKAPAAAAADSKLAEFQALRNKVTTKLGAKLSCTFETADAKIKERLAKAIEGATPEQRYDLSVAELKKVEAELSEG